MIKFIKKLFKIEDVSIIELIESANDVKRLNVILDEHFNNPEMEHLRRYEYSFYIRELDTDIIARFGNLTIRNGLLGNNTKPYGYRIGEIMAEFDSFTELKESIINTFFKSELRDQKINQLLNGTN